MDKRKNNTGTRGNRGRPSKAEELKIRAHIESAIKKEFGSVDKFWQHIVKESRSSTQHLKYILEYWIGKPTERKEIAVTEFPKMEVEYLGERSISKEDILT